MRLARLVWWVAPCAFAVVTACGGDDDGGAALEAVEVATVAPQAVVAGDTILAACLLVDADGATHVLPAEVEAELVFDPAGAVEDGDDGWIARSAGELEVACAVPSLELTDDTPVTLVVEPGAPAQVTTTVDDASITAGSSVVVECAAEDAYGNQVDASSATVQVSPCDPGNTVDDAEVTFTRAGAYSIACQLDGAQGDGAAVTVAPGLPGHLAVALSVEEAPLAIDQLVEMRHLVVDRFGNPTAATVVTTSQILTGAGPIESVGDHGFRYQGAGEYEITATVAPPTDEDVPLTADRIVTVTADGPAIRCEDPIDGAHLDVTPGTSIPFSGSVADVNGVADVSVNGASVTVGEDGTFTDEITTLFGINVIDIEVTNVADEVTRRVCAFRVAALSSDEDEHLAGAIGLRATEAGLDDGSTSADRASLSDLATEMAQHGTAADLLEEAIDAAGALKPEACDRWDGGCTLRSRVTAVGASLAGPRAVTLAPIADGLEMVARFDDVTVEVEVDGQLDDAPFDEAGELSLEFVEIRAVLELAAVDGHVSLHPVAGSLAVSTGDVSAASLGLEPEVIDVVERVAGRSIQIAAADALRRFALWRIAAGLDGLVAGVGVCELSTARSVPRLDGSDTIDVALSALASDAGVDTDGAVVEIASRALVVPLHARDSEVGLLALPAPGEIAADGEGLTAVTHAGVLAQGAQALWRANFYEVALAGAAIGGVSTSVLVESVMRLPPAIYLNGETVAVDLGGIDATIDEPGVFDGLAVTFAARAAASDASSPEELDFDTIAVNEIFYSTGAVELDADSQQALELILIRWVQHVVGETLAGPRPALPSPVLAVPATLVELGFSAGDEVRLVSPSLDHVGHHLVLRGDVGVE